MTKRNSDEYEFLRRYSIDFSDAIHSIKIMSRYRSLEVQIPLIRDIVVTYGRPFSGNKSDGLSNHRLSSKVYVPKRFQGLHQELIRLRMQQFAHSDLRYFKPKVKRFPGKRGDFYPMSFAGYDYSGLINRLPEISELIREVEGRVQSSIERFEGSS